MISFVSLSIFVLSIKKPVIDKLVSCYSSLRIVTAIVQEVACFHTGNLFIWISVIFAGNLSHIIKPFNERAGWRFSQC